MHKVGMGACVGWTNLLFGLGILLCSFPGVILAKNIASPLVQTLPLVPGRLERVGVKAF